MGNNLSLDETELLELSKATKYEPEVIKGMYNKFAKLDKKEKGYVSLSDLNQIIDFKDTEITKLVSQQMTSGVGDQVDFRKLIQSISNFHYNKEEEKLKCKIFYLFFFV